MELTKFKQDYGKTKIKYKKNEDWILSDQNK